MELEEFPEEVRDIIADRLREAADSIERGPTYGNIEKEMDVEEYSMDDEVAFGLNTELLEGHLVTEDKVVSFTIANK